MPVSECKTCGGSFQWHWEEPFCKFGFGDGDGQVETHTIQDGLIEEGYEVQILDWGMHNTIIVSIKVKGVEQIPNIVALGYDNPRTYLPRRVQRVLDRKFKSTTLYLF